MTKVKPKRRQPRVRREDPTFLKFKDELSNCSNDQLDLLAASIRSFVSEGTVSDELAPWLASSKPRLNQAA